MIRHHEYGDGGGTFEIEAWDETLKVHFEIDDYISLGSRAWQYLGTSADGTDHKFKVIHICTSRSASVKDELREPPSCESPKERQESCTSCISFMKGAQAGYLEPYD